MRGVGEGDGVIEGVVVTEQVTEGVRVAEDEAVRVGVVDCKKVGMARGVVEDDGKVIAVKVDEREREQDASLVEPAAHADGQLQTVHA